MNFNRNQIATLLMTALLAMAVITGGAAAALTYDSETTNTSTTSDWTGGETVTDLDNSSKQAELEVQSDNATSGDNFTLRFVVNDTASDQNGDTIYEDDSSWTATNASQGHYNKTVTYATVFEALERDAGETVTVDVVTVWNESESDEESETIQVHAENDANPNVVADDRATVKEVGPGFFSLSTLPFVSSDESADAARLEQTVNVTDNTTTISVAENDGNVSSALDEAVADTSSGDFTADAYVLMDGKMVPVFDSSADVDWIDTNADTYAVADGTGVTVHNVNETLESGTTSTDVVVVANGNLGMRDTYSMVNSYDGPALSAAYSAGAFSTFEEPSLEA